ncbi:MAG: hypothetical protein AB1765_10685 [Candidatus Hydrogenedentota bacterium]
MIKALFICSLIFTTNLLAEVNKLKVEVKDIKTNLVLVISAETDKDGYYVGYSLYTATYADPTKDLKSDLIKVENKKINKTITIPENFNNGSYEVALWGKKVEKKDCTNPGCQYCSTYGYHLENQLDYKYGQLTLSSSQTDTALLKSEEGCKFSFDARLVKDNVKKTCKIVARGYVVDGPIYLVRAIYRRGIRDIVREGDYKFIELKEGPFEKSWDITGDMVGGKYEISLWKKIVRKSECPNYNTKGCLWCSKYGFHLEDNLAYKSAKIK